MSNAKPIFVEWMHVIAWLPVALKLVPTRSVRNLRSHNDNVINWLNMLFSNLADFILNAVSH